jgi:hypothetical protein
MYANDNNGRYPIARVGSHNADWSDLEDMLGTTLPVDPLNTSDSSVDNAAHDGNYVYSYYGQNSPNWCYGKVYMLSFNLEKKKGDGDNDGVLPCSGGRRSHGNTFAVGMNSDGSITTPDLSGDSK